MFLAKLKQMRIWPQIILYTPAEAERLGAMVKQGLIPFDKLSVLYVLGRFSLTRTALPRDLLPFLAPRHAAVLIRGAYAPSAAARPPASPPPRCSGAMRGSASRTTSPCPMAPAPPRTPTWSAPPRRARSGRASDPDRGRLAGGDRGVPGSDGADRQSRPAPLIRARNRPRRFRARFGIDGLATMTAYSSEGGVELLDSQACRGASPTPPPKGRTPPPWTSPVARSMMGVEAVRRPPSRSLSPRHDHPLDHLRARADEAIILDDGRVRLQRLQHAADPDAAGKVHVPPIWAQEPTVTQVSTMVFAST